MRQHLTLYHISTERTFRGGERQLLYLAAALRSAGHRNIIYCRKHSPLYKEALNQNFEVRTLSYPCEFNLLCAMGLAFSARQEKALIHAHCAHSVAIAALASLFGCRFIAHRRVDFPITSLSRQLKYSRAKKIIAVSQAIKMILIQSGLPDNNISVLHDALPTSEIEWNWTQNINNAYTPPEVQERQKLRQLFSKELNLDPHYYWIGNLAALVAHKDHKNLINAASLIIKQHPSTYFLIAGEGDEKENLSGQINSLGLSKNVFLLGQRSDGVNLLKSLDLYVHSSSEEGMGSVLLEATACAVPIIATAAGGVPEIIRDGKTGRLVPIKEPAALAKAIIEVIRDPSQSLPWVKEGLKQIHNFSLTKMLSDIEEIYDGIS